MQRARNLADRRRRIHRLGAAVVLVVTPLALPLASTGAVDPSAVTAMQSFLAQPTFAHQYSASRRLEASGSGQRGWLDAQTRFTLASGLHYDVTAEGGSSYIRGRVLRSLLEEEKELIARGGSASVAISTDNYQFVPEGVDEEGLAVVGIRPLRKDRSLFIGRIFVTLDGELRRVEGRLAKNPSFWITRANVVRSYRRIGGVLMPVSLDTTAQLRFLGSSTLRMTYSYSCINEQRVEQAEEAAFEHEQVAADKRPDWGSPCAPATCPPGCA